MWQPWTGAPTGRCTPLPTTATASRCWMQTSASQNRSEPRSALQCTINATQILAVPSPITDMHTLPHAALRRSRDATELVVTGDTQGTCSCVNTTHSNARHRHPAHRDQQRAPGKVCRRVQKRHHLRALEPRRCVALVSSAPMTTRTRHHDCIRQRGGRGVLVVKSARQSTQRRGPGQPRNPATRLGSQQHRPRCRCRQRPAAVLPATQQLHPAGSGA